MLIYFEYFYIINIFKYHLIVLKAPLLNYIWSQFNSFCIFFGLIEYLKSCPGLSSTNSINWEQDLVEGFSLSSIEQIESTTSLLLFHLNHQYNISPTLDFAAILIIAFI